MSASNVWAPRDVWTFGRHVWRVGFVRHKWRWIVPIATLGLLQHFFAVGLAFDRSLPERLAIIAKWPAQIQRGDYIEWTWNRGGPFIHDGWHMFKIVKGIAGDVVSWQGRNVFINGQFLDVAKTHARTGAPVELGPSGVIPPGKYFVYGTNEDSLDSRYALTGWIDESQIVGRAIWRY